jgi:hypothetical protein
VANLIGGALRPDAVSLRCVQFALLWKLQRAVPTDGGYV